jgi:hypothetical protein
MLCLLQVLVHDGEQFPDISDRGFALGVGIETYRVINFSLLQFI